MKKIVMAVLFTAFMAGNVCAEKYISVLHDFKQSVKPVEYDEQNRVKFVKVLEGRIIQVFLDMNRNGETVSGKIIITDGQDAPEFIITNGIMKGNKIHIEAALAKNFRLNTFDYYGGEPYPVPVTFSLNGKQDEKTGEILFKVSCKPPFSSFFNGEELLFQKYSGEAGPYVKKYLKELKEYETKKTEHFVKVKNYHGAAHSKEMLAAFNINISGKLNKVISALKEYYSKELPKKIAGEIIFSNIEVKKTDPKKLHLKYRINVGEPLPVVFVQYQITAGENDVFTKRDSLEKQYYFGQDYIDKEEIIELNEDTDDLNVKFEVIGLMLRPYPEYSYNESGTQYLIQRAIKKSRTE